jgi:hypothetical protein
MLVSTKDGWLTVHDGERWHRGLTEEQAKTLGATVDEIAVARHRNDSHPLPRFDGKRYHVALAPYTKRDCIEHLIEDCGCDKRTAKHIVETSKLLWRLRRDFGIDFE